MKKRMMTAALAACLLLTACGSTAKAENAPAQNTAAATIAADDSEFIYCVGSVSKVYSTTAVMQLVDEGKVELDAPVTDYIPDFRMADPRYKDITVRMLMDHTSGIMGSSQVNGDLYDDNDNDRHDHLLEYLSKQRLKADPGKFAAYCNDGFGLLELITENVSGMSYTDYVRKNISGKLGVENTGTPIDMFRNEKLVPSVAAGNQRLETCYCMAIGDGGIYATAADTALFGASFFKGDHTLLSENAKNAMATRWNENAYCDENGLGWDYTALSRYQAQGVKVVGKGGDVSMDHAHLLVAPEEKISVAVLSNGGGSTYNQMVAEAIMDAVLEVNDDAAEDSAAPECTTVSKIPAEYEKYAGWYVVNVMGGGDSLYNVSFPEHKYLHIEETTHRTTTCKDYLLTTDGDFAELAYEIAENGFDTKLAPGYSRLSFEDTADGTFLRVQGALAYPGLGAFEVQTYAGQKIEENPVSDDVINGYRANEGTSFLLVGEKYSSGNYESAVGQLYVIDKLRGYVFFGGHGMDYILKMTDKNHLDSFKSIPSSSSRDMWDVTAERDGDRITGITVTNGWKLISEDTIPSLDTNVRTVMLTDTVAWYSIPDAAASSSVTVKRPDKSAVYVYNKFGEVIYTTHNKDAKPQIPMPKGGKVLFLGQPGDSFGLTM
ncbi:MAG: beta-lactamase family protein [Oscillospiraceae bacterium]|nr:beta-lactamase family protein [Oscillospiraceae bacterium]